MKLRPSRGTHLVLRPGTLPGLLSGLHVPIPGEGNRFALVLPQADGRVYVGLTDEPLDGPVPDVPEVPEEDVTCAARACSTRCWRHRSAARGRGGLRGAPAAAWRRAGGRPTSPGGTPCSRSEGRHGRGRQAHDIPADGGGRGGSGDLGAEPPGGPEPHHGSIAARRGCPGSAAPCPRRAGPGPRARAAGRPLRQRGGGRARPRQGAPRGGLSRHHHGRAALVRRARGRLDADDLLDRRTRIGLVPEDRAAALPAARAALPITPYPLTVRLVLPNSEVRGKALTRACEHPDGCHTGAVPNLASATVGARLWLLIEYDGPWPSHLETFELPERISNLVRRALERGIRPQLIRRPGRRARPQERDMHVLVGYATGPNPWLASGVIAGPDDLDLDALVAGVVPESCILGDEPVFLVCTHAKRNACCARIGLPLARTLGQKLCRTEYGKHHMLAAIDTPPTSCACHTGFTTAACLRLPRSRRPTRTGRARSFSTVTGDAQASLSHCKPPSISSEPIRVSVGRRSGRGILQVGRRRHRGHRALR